MITIKKLNETHLKIDSNDSGILQELSDKFTFFADNYKYHPKFKMKVWDGKIHLFNLMRQTLYVGLYSEVIKFCKDNDYEYQLIDAKPYGLPGQRVDTTPEEVVKFVDSLNIHSGGNKLDIRDYQYEAIYKAIKNQRLTILSSTGSGKSLIQYCILRYCLEKELRVLMIVPTQQLCYQMLSDFADYSSENGFDAESLIHLIMAGANKYIDKPVYVSTWQSLQRDKVDSKWLNSFDAIFCDEVHGASAKELQGIMEKATDVFIRLGFTGSLSKTKTNNLTIQGLFGEIVRVSSTKDLMEAGHLSELDIKCLVLKHGPETNHLFKSKVEYQKEIEFLIGHDKRNKFIRNLALSLKGNTLILFVRVEEHGQKIYDLISEKDPNRQTFFVHGGVEAEERDQVRHIVEKANDAIIVASAGVFSTGVNIKRLHNIIFASPTKSVIRVLQSIGRGLRKAHDKTHVTLYDISDKLNKGKSWNNHTYSHLIERLKIYSEEQFEYKITEIPF